jgi:tight adherence protein B
MGFLLALIFACGVGLVWFGAVVGVELPVPASRSGGLRVLLASAGAEIPVYAFVAMITGCGMAAGLVAWWIIGLPAAGIAGVLGGGMVPVGWARRRRERRAHEREQAWPAVLAQLADALQAGLAWPAAVSLAARSGPLALRGEWAAFAAKLRASDLDTALAGLEDAGERTTDSVVVLLRAALVDLPAGELAPMLRELSTVLSERLESREKARSRAATMHTEAAVLALSPIAILLLVGAVSPGYLSAYRGLGGTIVLLVGGAMIWGCYLLMRRLGRVPEPRRTQATGGRAS